MRTLHLTLLALCALPSLVHAARVCDIDGQSVNPDHGGTTAGKTGLMRCRDGEGGPLIREEELKNGVFMGVKRFYKDGQLLREYSVNERGNRDGRSREYEGGKLVSEETLRNSTTVGLHRRWYPEGGLRRVAFNGDDGRTQAEAEFTRKNQLRELRCGPAPLLAPDADDAAWCGFNNTGTGTVTLYAENGKPRGTLVHERGERRRSETLWDNGKPREQVEITPQGGVERSYADTGVKRRERHWVTLQTDTRTRRITVLEREYHESGTLTRERQWKPSERGELQLEQQWYLNGQLRDKQEHIEVDGQAARRDTQFHDNGRMAAEGVWRLAGRYDRQAIGVHKAYDADGRLRMEYHHDARGRLQRERVFDETGKVVRDDELFEDGSRKAYQTGT